MQQKIEEFREMLDTLEFKCWYYETAKSAGTTAVPAKMPDSELPPQFVSVRKRLKHQ